LLWTGRSADLSFSVARTITVRSVGKIYLQHLDEGRVMQNEILHIVTQVSNPIRWKSRNALARAAVLDWLNEPNVQVTLVECQNGTRSYQLEDLAGHARVTHVPVRATTMAWSKENLANIGISRLPQSAQYIGTFDADIHFRKAGWATEIMHALQLYPVIQPWKTAYDLGPNDEHLSAFKSFASQFHKGANVIPRFDPKTLQLTNSPYDYPHPGYAWAWTRKTLDRVGGLFEDGGMGSGDHIMALALIGRVEAAVPRGVDPAFMAIAKAWQATALSQVNKRLGYAHQTIEHQFHGAKKNRGYNSRWGMFLEHNFNPITDLKKNSYGVIEFSGNKPELERLWDNYLRSREEDANTTA